MSRLRIHRRARAVRRLTQGHAIANLPQRHRSRANALAAGTLLPARPLPCPTSSPAGTPFVTPLVTACGSTSHSWARPAVQHQQRQTGPRLGYCRRSHSSSQGFSAYRCRGMLIPSCHLLSSTASYGLSIKRRRQQSCIQKCLQGIKEGFLALLSFPLLELTPSMN